MTGSVGLTLQQRAYVRRFDRMLRRGWRCNVRLQVMLDGLALVVHGKAYARIEERQVRAARTPRRTW